MVNVFDGKKFTQKKERELTKDFSQLPVKRQRLRLVDILLGENPAANLYVNLKKQVAQRVGINFEIIKLPQGFSKKKLFALVQKLNRDKEVGGVMFQLPLLGLSKKDQLEIINVINFRKDVDCLTSQNLGRLMSGGSSFLPATVEAIIQILNHTEAGNHNLLGKKIVIVGRSNIVGKPLAVFLINQGATVTVCHHQTKELIRYTKTAEILISATGKHNLINKDMVSSGVVVIDVGSPKGDVDFGQVKERSDFITPVPGGVGPVTIVCLLNNFIKLLKYDKSTFGL
ncbi:MAG: bifunctional 5,10-methylenetetrahydrofolate dehydrogenase/5,10-methenyltetrahydrofolate cyclohydrolase [Candidatus Shapirobacteria bacterium]|nr:bifunctional 5,10-methylenetetrahydrofolate dehydrogenase/5,10-methenyltetrahydrofolate cyclohydrolase [Candidatus Shapirobacteria bacterium]